MHVLLEEIQYVYIHLTYPQRMEDRFEPWDIPWTWRKCLSPTCRTTMATTLKWVTF